jgi:hypothetical protein
VDNYHLQKRITSGKEFAHNDLEKLLAFEITLIRSEFDVEFHEHGGNLVLLEIHDSVEDLEYGIQDKLIESTFKLLAVCVGAVSSPFFRAGVEVVVPP